MSFDKNRLIEIAKEIERNIKRLNSEGGNCPTCGLFVYADKAEHKKKLELSSVARKLRRIAEGKDDVDPS